MPKKTEFDREERRKEHSKKDKDVIINEYLLLEEKFDVEYDEKIIADNERQYLRRRLLDKMQE